MTIYNYLQKTTIFVDIGFQSNTHLIYAETEILTSRTLKLKGLAAASLRLKTLTTIPTLRRTF